MLEQIASDERLQENYELVSSIKDATLINTVAVLVAAQNFSRFENSWQSACYVGITPFGK